MAQRSEAYEGETYVEPEVASGSPPIYSPRSTTPPRSPMAKVEKNGKHPDEEMRAVKAAAPKSPASSAIQPPVKPAPAPAPPVVAEVAGLGVVSQPGDHAGPDVNALLSVPDWVRLHPLLGAYLAEIIGTFSFVLTVALVEINNPLTNGLIDTNISPIPIGFMLMTVCLTLGYISGGHFNPCVTLTVYLYERANLFRYLMYVVCQCGAALGAGIVAMIIKGDEDIIVPDVNNDLGRIRKAFFAELGISFALCTVVLNVAHARKDATLYCGMAVGMVVTAGASAVGGVSGGAFNPALATGLQLAVCFVGRCTPFMHFWVYWLAPFAGAILAAIIFSNLYQPPLEELPQANTTEAPPVRAEQIA